MTYRKGTIANILVKHFKGGRLHDFQVGVSENSPNDITPAVTNYPLCATYSGPAGAVTDISCIAPVDGRYVIVQISGYTEYLTICELQVFGVGKPFPVVIGGIN